MDKLAWEELTSYLHQLIDKEIIIYTENLEFRGKLTAVTHSFALLKKERDLYETASFKRIIITKIVAISESLR